MSVSRRGECGVSFSKNGTNFEGREATLWKTPACTDLKWYMIFIPFLFKGFLLLGINAYIFLCIQLCEDFPRKCCFTGELPRPERRHIFCISNIWRCEEFALASYYLKSLLKQKWAYVMICVHCLRLSLGMWPIAPISKGDTTNRPLLKLQFLLLVFFLSKLFSHT